MTCSQLYKVCHLVLSIYCTVRLELHSPNVADLHTANFPQLSAASCCAYPQYFIPLSIPLLREGKADSALDFRCCRRWSRGCLCGFDTSGTRGSVSWSRHGQMRPACHRIHRNEMQEKFRRIFQDWLGLLVGTLLRNRMLVNNVRKSNPTSQH